MANKIQEIKEMIGVLLEEKKYKELETVKDMADYRADWAKPFDKVDSVKELQSVNDIFYFLCGVLRGLGIKKTWNGRGPSHIKQKCTCGENESCSDCPEKNDVNVLNRDGDKNGK